MKIELVCGGDVMRKKFKVGDKVMIKPWHMAGVVCLIDDINLDSTLPYLVEDGDGQTSWWHDSDLELNNEQI